MFDLSALSEVKRKFDLKAVTSAFDPQRTFSLFREVSQDHFSFVSLAQE